VFLAIVIGGSLILYAARAGMVASRAEFAPVSRETMLLANNVLLIVAMGAVLLGTLYPLFLDALDLGKVSVGPPYFEAVFVPLMTPALFLMAIGPLASWKRVALPDLWTRLRWALAISAVTALVAPLAFGRWSPGVAFGLWLALWIAAATLAHALQRFSNASQRGFAAKIAAQPLGWYG